MMKRTKISHRKFVLEKRDNALKKIRRGSCKNNIIDIEKKIGNMMIGMINKERIIRTRRRKTNCLNKSRESLKPGTRSLFETVERLLEETNVIGRVRIFKT